MSLAAEDALRLNVLLANRPQALRIDESRMMVHGLTAEGEFKVPLHPQGRPDRYLRSVRELFSSHAMDSPGGYPVFLKRWTRMGQAKDEHLERLLLLGEPEAVVAVVGASGLTNEIARRAWWAFCNAENARSMLRCDVVAKGSMGIILGQYLLDHLAFETNPVKICQTVRLLVQSGVVDKQGRYFLWSKADKQSSCRIGFLLADRNNLPLALPRRQTESDEEILRLATKGNSYARYLEWSFSEKGQSFLNVAHAALENIENQEMVEILFAILSRAFLAVREEKQHWDDIECMQTEIRSWCMAGNFSPKQMPVDAEVLIWWEELAAIIFLANLDKCQLQASFTRSSAIGASMRKKLQPVTEPIFEAIRQLLARQNQPNIKKKGRRGRKKHSMPHKR